MAVELIHRFTPLTVHNPNSSMISCTPVTQCTCNVVYYLLPGVLEIRLLIEISVSFTQMVNSIANMLRIVLSSSTSQFIDCCRRHSFVVVKCTLLIWVSSWVVASKPIVKSVVAAVCNSATAPNSQATSSTALRWGTLSRSSSLRLCNWLIRTGMFAMGVLFIIVKHMHPCCWGVSLLVHLWLDNTGSLQSFDCFFEDKIVKFGCLTSSTLSFHFSWTFLHWWIETIFLFFLLSQNLSNCLCAF